MNISDPHREQGATFEGSIASHKTHQSRLRVVIVYQDSVTRDWAAELWGRVSQLVGRDGVSLHWWRIDDLVQSAAFPEAVRHGAEADVILIGCRVSDTLPVPLYVWIDAWLPRRRQTGGALAALLGISEESGGVSSHPQEYLRAVARRAGMDFLPRERKLHHPGGAPVGDDLRHRADTVTLTLGDILAQQRERGYRHWGINE